MKLHKFFFSTLAAVLAATASTVFAATSTPEGFTDNLDEALQKASRENKLVMAVFSGSDWCGWCKKLEKEILSDKEFINSIRTFIIPVYIDNPQNQDLLSDYGKKNNRKTTSKYKISGFPTVLILDKSGTVLNKTGYRRGGAKEYAKHLLGLTSNLPEKTKWLNPIATKIGDFESKVKKDSEKIRAEIFEELGKDIQTLKRSERGRIYEKVAMRVAKEVFPDAITNARTLLAEVKRAKAKAPKSIQKEFEPLQKKLEQTISFMTMGISAARAGRRPPQIR